MPVFIKFSDIASNDVFSNSTHFITKNPSNNAIGINWKRYHNLEAIYDYLLQMEDLHPDLIKVDLILSCRINNDNCNFYLCWKPSYKRKLV